MIERFIHTHYVRSIKFSNENFIHTHCVPSINFSSETVTLIF